MITREDTLQAVDVKASGKLFPKVTCLIWPCLDSVSAELISLLKAI